MDTGIGELAQVARAIAALEELELPLVFNPDRPDLDPTPVQQDILEDWSVRQKYLVAGNRTGKTQLGARIVSWWFEGNHPYMERPDDWGTGPLKIIILGQKLEQMDTELWEGKLKRYLPKAKIDAKVYKEKRAGGVLQRVTNTENGNMIIFQSHNNVNQARRDIQGHTAQIVWLDEMPASASLFIELKTRLMTQKGILLATFTPLIRCLEVKDIVDGIKEPLGKKYQMAMFDNPLFKGREKELLAEFANVSEAERRARLYGEWFMGSNAVFDFDASRYIEFPQGYSPLWRHLEMVDPASTGSFGFLLGAENPDTHVWYVVKSEYMKGDAPSTLVDECAKRTKNVNRVAGVADTAESWFISEARKNKITYRAPVKKDRKLEMVEQTKQKLFESTWRISPECTELLRELSSMQWSETTPGSIVNSKKYHTAHALFYGIDVTPPPARPGTFNTWQQNLVEADNKRRAAEAAKSAKGSRRRRRPRRKRNRL